MGWNLTSPNAIFCTWDGVTPGSSTSWGRSGRRAALQGGSWGCWSATDSIGASSVPGQPRGQTSAPWSTSNPARPARHKRGLSWCVQRWCSLTSSAVSRSGPHHIRRMWRSLNVSRGGQHSWWKGWKARPGRSGWGLWACLAWRRGGRGATSLLWPASRGGDMGREVLSSPPWYPGTGCFWMAQSFTRAGSHWTRGSISLLRGWPNTGTVFLERWLMPQACPCFRERHLGNVLNNPLWLC